MLILIWNRRVSHVASQEFLLVRGLWKIQVFIVYNFFILLVVHNKL